MGAPGASRRLALSMTAAGVVYVAARLIWHQPGPLFEQAIGFGFSEMEPPEATARFGAFPLWIFAYNGLSTVANVLFSEPTRGVFSIFVFSWPIPGWLAGDSPAFFAAMTGIIAWWGIGALKTPLRVVPRRATFRRVPPCSSPAGS